MHGPEYILGWLRQYIDVTKSGLEGTIYSLPSRVSQLLIRVAASLVAGLAGFIGESLITLLVLFFVLRDGADIARRAALLVPLDSRRVERLFTRTRESIFANLYGILAVALAQGLLTSAAIAIVGVGAPLILGAAAAVCSLIPIVGPTLVWVPVAIFLFAKGQWWKGFFLVAWGALAVGTADNVIRPLVIASHVRLHPVLLLFALIGGVEQFGFIGLFIGPVVISLIIAVAEMLREEFYSPTAAFIDP
jgi:predicted PurR-regulated permease PerM